MEGGADVRFGLGPDTAAMAGQYGSTTQAPAARIAKRVNAYVVKPVDVDQFFGAVKTLGKFWALINQAPERE